MFVWWKHEIQNQYLYSSSVPRGSYFFSLISISCWLDKERAAVRPEQSTSQFVSSNSANTENLSSTSRPRLIENEDRLPGDVLLARARLLERLRGVPISANRSVLNVICNLVFFRGWVWTLHENYYLLYVIDNIFMPKLSLYICEIPRFTATNAVDGEVMKLLHRSIWYHILRSDDGSNFLIWLHF